MRSGGDGCRRMKTSADAADLGSGDILPAKPADRRRRYVTLPRREEFRDFLVAEIFGPQDSHRLLVRSERGTGANPRFMTQGRFEQVGFELFEVVGHWPI